MGKNIVIAFVSIFSNVFDINKAPEPYQYGKEGKFVTGRQTNEAPLKYLLSEYKIDQIICLVSESAQKAPDEAMREKQGRGSPYQYLSDQIKAFALARGMEKQFVEKDLFVEVDFKESEEDYFTQTIFPAILQRIHKDDTIFLETTGGQRNNVTQMMLLARILKYQGTKLECAVYSDFSKGKIFDVTDSYRDFDLVNGLNEFSRTGATGTLKSYFEDGSAATTTAEELREAMQKLTEAIMLGNLSRIDERKQAVKDALKKAETERGKDSGNAILSVLYQLCTNKYSQISTIPDLIIWCAENNLIQLAFTLYKDWLPKYLIKDAGLVSFKGIDPEKFSAPDGKELKPNRYCYLFDNQYVRDQSRRIKIFDEMTGKKILDDYVKLILKFKAFRESHADHIVYKAGVSDEYMKTLLCHYSYAILIRNIFNHAVDQSYRPTHYEKDRIKFLSGRSFRAEDEKTGVTQEYPYIVTLNDLTVEYLKKFLVSAMKQILALTKNTNDSDNP